MFQPPQLTDLDGDGDTEMIVNVVFRERESATGIYVYDLDMPYNTPNIHWGAEYHDSYNTNNYNVNMELIYPTEGTVLDAGSTLLPKSLRWISAEFMIPPERIIKSDISAKLDNTYELELLFYQYHKKVLKMGFKTQYNVPPGLYDLTVFCDAGIPTWATVKDCVQVQETGEYQKDLVVIIDNSKSMADDNKLDTAKTYALNYLADHHYNTAEIEAKLGIVSFSDTENDYGAEFFINEEEQLLDIIDDISIDPASAGIDDNTTSTPGATSIGAGMNGALSYYRNDGFEQNMPEILLISDGIHNLGPSWEEILEDIRYYYYPFITINTVEISASGAQPSVLSDIADETGGTYTHITVPE